MTDPRADGLRVDRATARASPLGHSRPGSVEHVVHVGYHKTASTWLQLSVFPSLAGMRYGDPLLRRLAADLASSAPRSFFAMGFRDVLERLERLPGGPLLLSHEGISGSLWDGYGAGPRNAERLSAVLPGALILVVVRRQDEMLRSIHAQYVNEGGTRTLRDFVAGQGVEGSQFTLRHLEYDRLIGRYVDLFGRDRVWVAPYEYLRARRERFLADLCERLGTELTRRPSRARENRSLSAPSLWLLRSWNRLFRDSRFNPNPLVAPFRGARRMRDLLQRRLDPVIRHVTPKGAGRPDAGLLAELAARFARSNERLQRFCPYSLAEWGYPLDRNASNRAGASLPQLSEEGADVGSEGVGLLEGGEVTARGHEGPALDVDSWMTTTRLLTTAPHSA